MERQIGVFEALAARVSAVLWLRRCGRSGLALCFFCREVTSSMLIESSGTPKPDQSRLQFFKPMSR